MNLRTRVADLVSPVLPAIPVQSPEASQPEEMFSCTNPRCCAYLPWGMLKCPWCSQDQQRLRPVAVQQRLSDAEVLYALEPDRPYDWTVDGL